MPACSLHESSWHSKLQPASAGDISTRCGSLIYRERQMAATGLGCVPDSDDEGPVVRAPRQAALIDCEGIVSDGEESVGPWQQQSWGAVGTAAHAAPQVLAEEPAGGALRQLNAQLLLPPLGSQHCHGAGQVGGKSFRRRAVTGDTKPAAAASSTARCGSRSGFRRSMKTAEAAQADRAAAERAAADEAELSAALAPVGTAAPGGEGAPEQRTFRGEVSVCLSRQQQRKAAGSTCNQYAVTQAAPHARNPAAVAAVPPASRAGGPSFLNRMALPRQPSQAAEERQESQERGDPSVRTMLPPASAATTMRKEVEAAMHVRPCSAAAVNRPPSGEQADAERRADRAAPPAARRQPALPRPPSGGQTANAPPMVAAAQQPATFHRTADGLNVIFLNRQPAAAAASAAGSKGKAEGVNSGWGNNFVKMDLKVGPWGGCKMGQGCISACNS